jgi:ribonuclease HI
MKYYSVHKGRETGIFTTWEDCKKQIDKYKGAIYKSFKKKEDAEKFVKNGKKIIQVKEKKTKKIFSIIELGEETFGENRVNIYTDGSLITLNNKKYCGYGVFIPSKDIKKRVIIQKNKTNNRAELSAIIKAIQLSEKKEELHIYTDSKYCILIGTTTGNRYKRNNYKTGKGDDVLNKDLIKKLHKIRLGYNIHYHHIKAHTGYSDEHSLYNQVTDDLAKSAAMTSFRMKK